MKKSLLIIALVFSGFLVAGAQTRVVVRTPVRRVVVTRRPVAIVRPGGTVVVRPVRRVVVHPVTHTVVVRRVRRPVVVVHR